jgi:hypothetical protein
MKLPSMTKSVQWFYLLILIIVQGVLATLCFLAGPPFSYIGFILVIAGNIEWIGAAILGLTNISKKNS